MLIPLLVSVAAAGLTLALRWFLRQVWQMARLLEDLMDVSRIKRGKIVVRKETVALAEVVESR